MKRRGDLLILLNPIGNGIVGECHFVRIVARIPFGVAVGEQDVLSQRVDLPKYKRRAVDRPTGAILRIIILVGVQRIEFFAVVAGCLIRDAARVARQDL